MTDRLTNPHDRFFKQLFSRQDAAQDFLQHYLPHDVRVLLDLDALEIRKDSFVDLELNEHFSDLLYQIPLYSGEQSYIYLLFEHKSSPERRIALQLLRYMLRIWEQDEQQHEPLRPILPLVLYHGQAKWTVGQHFHDLFSLPQALQKYVPDFSHELYDLSQYSDTEIRGQVILRVGLLLLKYIYRDELPERLPAILRLLRTLSQQRTGLEYLETILRYLSGSTDKVGLNELSQIVTEVIKEGERLMPTIAEQLVQEGLEQGLEQGREAALHMVRQMIHHRFNLSLNHFDATLATLDLAALTTLSDHVFDVSDQDAFEAFLASLSPRSTDRTAPE